MSGRRPEAKFKDQLKQTHQNQRRVTKLRFWWSDESHEQFRHHCNFEGWCHIKNPLADNGSDCTWCSKCNGAQHPIPWKDSFRWGWFIIEITPLQEGSQKGSLRNQINHPSTRRKPKKWPKEPKWRFSLLVSLISNFLSVGHVLIVFVSAEVENKLIGTVPQQIEISEYEQLEPCSTLVMRWCNLSFSFPFTFPSKNVFWITKVECNSIWRHTQHCPFLICLVSLPLSISQNLSFHVSIVELIYEEMNFLLKKVFLCL